MLPQAVPGMSQSTPRSLDHLASDERRSLVDAASLGCIVNMWVIGGLELVFAPGVGPQYLRAPLNVGKRTLTYVLQSPDGSRVAMSSEAGQIFIFDVATNSIQVAYSSHAMAVRSFAWSADSTVRLSLAKVMHI